MQIREVSYLAGVVSSYKIFMTILWAKNPKGCVAESYSLKYSPTVAQLPVTYC